LEDDFLEDDFFDDDFFGATGAAGAGAGAGTGVGSMVVATPASAAGVAAAACSDGKYILPPPLTYMSGIFVQPPAAKVLAVSGAGAVPALGTYMPPPPLMSTCCGIVYAPPEYCAML